MTNYAREIKGFSGEYRFLSNFWLVDFKVDGEKYNCSEQFYMAAKCKNQRDRDRIMSFTKPTDMKKFGKTVELVDGWESKVKDKSMMAALKAKFSTPTMKGLLYNTTGAYLEETNHWNDTYWGVCNGVGKNQLGKMLMWLRDHYLFKDFEDVPF